MYRLREIEDKDMAIINEWRNNSKLISMLAAPYRYINQIVDRNWFEGYMKNRQSQVRCSIVTDESDEIMGMVSLTSIDHLNQSAEFHIMIGDENNQGKGIGTFAVNEMLKHAFNNLNLQRIELKVLESNTRAQHLYEKCGFVKEGTLRNYVYKNGKFVNMHIYSILKNEYSKQIFGGQSSFYYYLLSPRELYAA